MEQPQRKKGNSQNKISRHKSKDTQQQNQEASSRSKRKTTSKPLQGSVMKNLHFQVKDTLYQPLNGQSSLKKT